MSTRSKQLVMKLGPDDSVLRLELPAPSTRLLEGVRWGRYDEMFTPAFWATRLWIDADESVTAARPDYQLGQTLAEEVVACMLGGFGMPAEVGLAAFRRLQARGLIYGEVSEEERQDLQSIFQVVIRSVEESLPVDFCCVCLYDPTANTRTVNSVGVGIRVY